MKFRNFPQVPFVCFGRGSLNQLEEILEPHRKGDAPFIFFIDNFFNGKTEFVSRFPLKGRDEIIFVDVDPHEPSTWQVDALRDEIVEKYGTASGIIGVGGGSVMDIAKAVALMLTNPGSAADYQGWDLVKVPGVFHMAIPTISGTGAEVSRTAVLIGPEKKLGLNSDFTPMNQVLLDPELIHNVPKNQRFFTGMDNYIHCVESLNGTYLNAFSKAYGEKAEEMCLKAFLGTDEWTDECDDDLMMASWMGGMSIAYSQVGAAHAMSYGLAVVFGVRHGVGCCIAFNQLGEIYPEGVANFHKMIEKWNIDLPKGVCANATEEQMQTMIKVAQGMVPLWENCLGKDWQKIMTPEKMRSLFEKM
ncbi:MAG: iron-containing alcohol dehydrogenase [Flavobacteriales bacterium]|nr:iron-containing alcohol dehydrogenase [Flavobacteriales bacterium]